MVFYIEKDNAERLDVLAASETGFTRSRIKGLIDDGKVTFNGVTVKKSGEIFKNGTCEVFDDEVTEISAKPQDISLDIVYQDAYIAVINKAQGMVVHPCEGTPDGTLVNAAMFHIKDLSAINGTLRPGIVHRLDKDTSGLIVVAKNNEAHLKMAKQIEEKTAGRYYTALVAGNVKEDSGTIDAPIARSKRDRKVMCVDAGGRRAVTHYAVLERFGNFTLVEFKLETGRTHQIRVHAKHIKRPVVGDTVYGSEVKGLKGQLLHAHKLVLTHPSSGEIMEFTAPLPDYFANCLKKLKTLN